MSDAYVECLVKGKKNVLAMMGRVVLFILCAGFFLLSVFGGNTLGSWWILFFILAFAAGTGGYILGTFINVEYEYFYLDRELSIDVIYNQSKRKRLVTYSIDRIEVLCPMKSYHLSNYGTRSMKPKDYSIGVEEQPDLRYIMYLEGGEVVYLSPNEELIRMMKHAAPRKVFND